MKNIEKIIRKYATESARDVKFEAMDGFTERQTILRDARNEIKLIKALLRDCRPFVADMVGIASAARPLLQSIDDFLED